MISLRSLFFKFKQVRALTAGTFFLLIIPQKVQTLVEPVTLSYILGYGIAGGVFLYDWWYKRSIETNSAKVFNPNCAKCLQERALSEPAQPVPAPVVTAAQQAPETRVSQTTYSQTTYNTTIHAQRGNTVIVAPEVAAQQPQPVSTPNQTVQTHQTTRAAVQPPEKAVQDITPATSKSVGHNVSSAKIDFHERIKDLYQNHLNEIAFGTAATGYLYMLYSINSMQRYLTDPQRVSLWFSEYDLNKLLLIEPDQMQELIVQEFITRYTVSDQKSLKVAVTKFMNDSETELALIDQYQRITGFLDTVSSCAESCCSACTYLARTAIPFAGIALDYMPAVGLHNLFFVNSALKTSIQERISRIHYYKNIFLQSPIVV